MLGHLQTYSSQPILIYPLLPATYSNLSRCRYSISEGHPPAHEPTLLNLLSFCACFSVCFDQARTEWLLLLLTSEMDFVYTKDSLYVRLEGFGQLWSLMMETAPREDVIPIPVSYRILEPLMSNSICKQDLSPVLWSSLFILTAARKGFFMSNGLKKKTFISYLVFVSAVSNRPIRCTQNINSNGRC